MRAPLPCSQTFVEEDAGHPERGEEQREVLAAVHSAIGVGRCEGIHHGLGPCGPGLPRSTPRLAPSRRVSLGSVYALELWWAGGQRRRHMEGPARGDHLQGEVGWGQSGLESGLATRSLSRAPPPIWPPTFYSCFHSELFGTTLSRGPPVPALLRACPESMTLRGKGRVYPGAPWECRERGCQA